MTIQEFNALTLGAAVRVIKSGKVYRAHSIHTEEQHRQERARKLADPVSRQWCVSDDSFEKWMSEAHADGRNQLFFVQERANSKGVVGPYGPTMTLKPENIESIA